ncbi:MAG: tRNA (guanosine(46)-N7)-methyltransferase TrmB [Clostridia bacterium]|nr:tRNA (guanosine(46)-N7)-methyltransferase TrmB [Clostridia bacterium]
MRARPRKNLDKRMEACKAYLPENPESLKGKWREKFGKADAPLHVEIGCGKGKFINELALQNPDTLYIAIEKIPSVLLLALEKAVAAKPDNLLFLSYDAALLGEVFDTDEIDRIYLNFSDPWPPKKQWKRRLTHQRQLDVYKQFLKKDGEIIQKTDNVPLFEFSVCELSKNGFVIEELSTDLHKTDIPNIMTEYETRFSEAGIKINRLVARLK